MRNIPTLSLDTVKCTRKETVWKIKRFLIILLCLDINYASYIVVTDYMLLRIALSVAELVHEGYKIEKRQLVGS